MDSKLLIWEELRLEEGMLPEAVPVTPVAPEGPAVMPDVIPIPAPMPPHGLQELMAAGAGAAAPPAQPRGTV